MFVIGIDHGAIDFAARRMSIVDEQSMQYGNRKRGQKSINAWCSIATLR
jgi:hypothetical protein